MFTGIIEAVGKIRFIEESGSDRVFIIDSGKLDLSDVKVGNSICINGVCLTVTELDEAGFNMDVSTETLSCTTLASLKLNDPVNLEKALRLSERLSGHIVNGHIDAVGCIESLHEEARSIRYHIAGPEHLNRYLCKKGSICIDGVSLTINDVVGNTFSVNIIPHTQQETIISSYKVGTKVNLEVDLIARYLEGLLRTDSDT